MTNWQWTREELTRDEQQNERRRTRHWESEERKVRRSRAEGYCRCRCFCCVAQQVRGKKRERERDRAKERNCEARKHANLKTEGGKYLARHDDGLANLEQRTNARTLLKNCTDETTGNQANPRETCLRKASQHLITVAKKEEKMT